MKIAFYVVGQYGPRTSEQQYWDGLTWTARLDRAIKFFDRASARKINSGHKLRGYAIAVSGD
jgi:hypothetical protein